VTSEQGRFFIATQDSGLQDRIIVAPFSGGDGSWQLIHILSGALELTVAENSDGEVLTQITAPALLCQPVKAHQSIKLLAGSSCLHLAVDEIGMFAAVGSRPEAVELHMMIGDTVSLSFQDHPKEEAHIAKSFSGIASEIKGGEPGRQTISKLSCVVFWCAYGGTAVMQVKLYQPMVRKRSFCADFVSWSKRSIAIDGAYKTMQPLWAQHPTDYIMLRPNRWIDPHSI